jgi:integrase
VKNGYVRCHLLHKAAAPIMESGRSAVTAFAVPRSSSCIRNSLAAVAGLPNIRFHDLRHTCATLLFSRGVHPKHVQELLGHATIAITLDTYSHVIPGMGDQTARAMEDALSHEPS